MTQEIHPVEKLILDRQPDLGSGDESKCLPDWIGSFCRKWDEGGEMVLSHNAVGNLLHTLVAAQQRTRRLVKERDRVTEPRKEGDLEIS